ncbi:SDR family NAD(P)-dependent oxidoreductase [Thiofilum flexile]|uniref:SDR family NAD(P)-dependent oxidoreductase n=1 Tax=Thiofilum flexile TaxID=125627 RepID=UPI000371F419|nr:SDR family oxidoreductase [Thiofilum flexile]
MSNTFNTGIEQIPLTQKQSQKHYQTQHDQAIIAATQRYRQEPLFLEDGTLLGQPQTLLNYQPSSHTLFRPRRCYICKERYVEVHHFYHQLCPHCADYNYQQRTNNADLNGRAALVTGGRIKIGYEIALKLLRAGAHVIVTTRFKHDAVARYMQERDYPEWQQRLTIYGLDLRHIPTVESFISYLTTQGQPIDILINNAAQTIKKSDDYYRAMAIREQKCLPLAASNCLGSFKDKQLEQYQQHYLSLPTHHHIHTESKVDEFGEPLDRRPHNSWLSTLESVDTVEYLETQIINAMAPFLFNSRLKPLMMQSPFPQRFIVNVSAMEGQFNRENKTHRHPHTNMAKAALNMMTRTSAQDYQQVGIYMNSVDTGWVTQENPFPIKERNRRKGIVPPLDCIDGAARVLVPIFDAVNNKGLVYGKFLKDYQPTAW